MHGHGKEVVNHFEWMSEKHDQLDNTTFVCFFLSNYNHVGSINEACIVML
jgi:hypothetical protein